MPSSELSVPLRGQTVVYPQTSLILLALINIKVLALAKRKVYY